MLRTLRRVNENFSINNSISQASRSFSITPVARSSTAEPQQEGKDEFEKLLDSVNSVRNEPKMSIGNSANALRKVRVFYANRYQPGDFYSPEQLENDEKRPLRAPKGKSVISGLDFVKEYKNVALLSQHVNHSGQLLSMRETGLTKDEQHKMRKLVNRAIAFGIIPRTRKHWKAVGKF